MTKQTPHMKTAQTKKNCNRGIALELLRACARAYVCAFVCVCVCVCVVGLGVGRLKLVLLARIIALNSDAAPNHMYMFGKRHSEKYTINIAVMKQSKVINGGLKSEPRWDRPQTLLARRQLGAVI